MAEREIDSLSSTLDSPSIALTTAVVTIAVFVALRVVIGPLINDPILPITYLGVLGGIIGAFGMVFAFDALGFSGPTPAAQFWARMIGNVDPDAAVRPGMYVHLVYGAVAGGFYPRIVWIATGNGWYNSLPDGLLAGIVFATGLFVLAILYRFVGLYDMDMSVSMLVRYYAFHLVYGVLLGLVAGLHSFLFG